MEGICKITVVLSVRTANNISSVKYHRTWSDRLADELKNMIDRAGSVTIARIEEGWV